MPEERGNAVAAQQGEVVGHAVERIGVVAGDEQAAALLGKFVDLLKLRVAEILLRRSDEQQSHIGEGILGGQVDGHMVVAVALQKGQQQLQRIRGELAMPCTTPTVGGSVCATEAMASVRDFS